MSRDGDNTGPLASKEQMAGAIKVGFARMRVDYTETVFDGSICIETYGESQYPALEKYHVLSKCIALTLNSSVETVMVVRRADKHWLKSLSTVSPLWC